MRNSPPVAGVWRIMGEVSLETVTAALCLEPRSLAWHKQSSLTGPAVAQVEVPGIGSELRQTVQPGALYSMHLMDFRSCCSWRNSGAANSLPALSGLAPSPAVTPGVHVLGI